ncbi:hypothetical protein [Calycomorphotria hydatis]|uniref:Uncharacterized protein n=1 Tax=Calycomorphotria hydatis TaxID=2528027 RepID=A0A517T9J6_9PLAN|nr:hypothetical protein [Calycomorphotria hydatis]QDT65041.1 hypothetical protein V22_22870 [Calycomorphotria hydatis]
MRLRLPKGTFRSAFLLCLLIAGAGACAFYYYREHCDELLRDLTQSQLQEMFPGAVVQLDDAHFDWDEHIEVRNLSFRTVSQKQIGDPQPSADSPAVLIPDTIIEIDRKELLKNYRVDVRSIRLVNPKIELTRFPDGTWSASDLFPKARETSGPNPAIKIENATVSIKLLQTGNVKPLVLTFTGANLHLLPNGTHQFLLNGETTVQQETRCRIDGRFDVAHKTWRLDGNVDGIRTTGGLAGFLLASNPTLGDKVAGLNERIARETSDLEFGRPVPSPIRTVSQSEELTSPPRSRDGVELLLNGTPQHDRRVPNFGVEAVVDVKFALEKSSSDQPLDYDVSLICRDGRIDNPLLPFPLEKLNGELSYADGKLNIKKLEARHGTTQLSVHGNCNKVADNPTGRLHFKLTDLQLGRDLVARMPPQMHGLQELLEKLRPEGSGDISVDLVRDGGAAWRPENFLAVAKQMSALPIVFPYLVRNVTGTIRQTGKDKVAINFEGKAGDFPVSAKGVVAKIGQPVEVAVQINVPHAVLDQTALDALRPDIQNVVTTMGAGGSGNINLKLYRPSVMEAPLQWVLDVGIGDGYVNYKGFPYAIEHITGRLQFDSVTRVWSFENLSGVHGQSPILGAGQFRPEGEQDRLLLTIKAEQVPLAADLYNAVPDELKKSWSRLRPEGRIQNLTAIVDWVPGTPAVVTLPEINVVNGHILHRDFPYAIDQVASRMNYKPGRLTIEEFSGIHGQTPIQANGFIEYNDAGAWRLRLDRLTADRFHADQSFRQAIAGNFRSAVESLNPRGPMNLGGVLELRGTPDENGPVSAAWNLDSRFQSIDFNAGTPVTNAGGRVSSRGTFDGVEAEINASFAIDQATVLEHQVRNMRGPVSYRDQKLVVGSERVFNTQQRQGAAVPTSERVSGDFIGGRLTLDAMMRTEGEYRYASRVTLSGGRVENYSREYWQGARNLEGVVNAWTDISGKAVDPTGQSFRGKGQFEISPAALYELPALVQTFKVLNFAPPDSTAFKYAFADFRLDDQHVIFDQIDFVGDAISLRGRGTATYEKQLNLNFVSMRPKTRLPIPIVDSFLTQATAGWVGVQIRGDVGAPSARVVAAPALDSAFQRLIDVLEPSENSRPSEFRIPGIPSVSLPQEFRRRTTNRTW